jgi:hypothetical protein
MISDLKLALRSLLRTPAFAAIWILALAVGIGVNMTIFSVVDGALIAGLRIPAWRTSRVGPSIALRAE